MKNKLNIFLICLIFMLCTAIVLLSYNVYKLTNFDTLSNDGVNELRGTKGDLEILLDVPTLCQYPELATGCESVSATMVLNFYGIDISSTEFASDLLVCDDEFIKSGNKTFGPDPNEVFVGNPFEAYGYGCYAPAIEKAINDSCLNCKAEFINSKTLDELCSEYITNGEPILVWVTLRMEELEEGESWYIDDDTLFTWMSGEHCMVLVGFDEKYYLFNDPMTGGILAYKKDISQHRFSDMGMQALRIVSE